MENQEITRIGLFDSGIGGLTVLEAFRRAFPGESFVYLGDTARLPYGTKSAQTIERYALTAAQYLLKQKLKALVIACNTASAYGLQSVQTQAAKLPVIGMIEPAARVAISATKNRHIAVLGTQATIRGASYTKALKALDPQGTLRITPIAAQVMVAIAEEGWTKGALSQAIVQEYLKPILAQQPRERPDTIIMGCTHFPALVDSIRAVLGYDVRLVDCGEAAASELKLMLSGTPECHVHAQTQYFVTDDPARFVRGANMFTADPIDQDFVELVDI